MNSIEKLIDLIENPSTHPDYQLELEKMLPDRGKEVASLKEEILTLRRDQKIP